MSAAPLPFHRRTEAGVADPNLRRSMEIAQGALFRSAREAMSHPDFQKWRDEGAWIRDSALRRLDENLRRFEGRARDAGAEVHWARDAAAARRIVTGIARKHGCAKAIKSKSMLSEEIGLNDGLEGMGLDVLETDLGEYVVQISGGRPSHIIAPIIHMTGGQVAELFESRHGERERPDKEAMVREARELLRPRMLEADMGITGANFLVASTGSAVLVTNEGNGRYCAGMPRVRVTVAGIEKVVADHEDLAVLLRLLPRAATGQQTSAYVTVVTGTRASKTPEHHHIVLVDNGRSAMLAGKFRRMLRCIRCGSCMNNCPVYRTAGGLSYGSVYPGPMGIVLSPLLFGGRHDELPHAATMCGACDAACPVKIPLTDLMRNLREDQVDSGGESLLSRAMFAAWRFAALRPPLYAAMSSAASWALRGLAGADGVLRSVPGGGRWFGERNLRIPPGKPFRSGLDGKTRQ